MSSSHDGATDKESLFLCQLILQILVLLTGGEQITEIRDLLVQCPALNSTFTSGVGIFTTRIVGARRNVSALAARMFAIETGAPSASGVSGTPVGSWPPLGDVDGSTATGVPCPKFYGRQQKHATKTRNKPG